METFKGTKYEGDWTADEYGRVNQDTVYGVRANGLKVCITSVFIGDEQALGSEVVNLFARAGNLAQKHDPNTWEAKLDLWDDLVKYLQMSYEPMKEKAMEDSDNALICEGIRELILKTNALTKEGEA